MKELAEDGLQNSKGDFTLEDEDRTGRPVEFDEKLLEAALKENPALSVEELAVVLSSNHTTVHCHLQQLGKMGAS